MPLLSISLGTLVNVIRQEKEWRIVITTIVCRYYDRMKLFVNDIIINIKCQSEFTDQLLEYEDSENDLDTALSYKNQYSSFTLSIIK